MHPGRTIHLAEAASAWCLMLFFFFFGDSSKCVRELVLFFHTRALFDFQPGLLGKQ